MPGMMREERSRFEVYAEARDMSILRGPNDSARYATAETEEASRIWHQGWQEATKAMRDRCAEVCMELAREEGLGGPEAEIATEAADRINALPIGE